MAREKRVSGVHTWLLLQRAADAIKSHATADLAKLGIGITDFGILETILHKGELPINELGGKLLITSGSITSAVDRMEAKAFVKRKLSSKDRRVRVVALTPRGRIFIEKAFKEHSDAMAVATAGLTSKEKESLAILLKKLGKSANRKRGK